MSGTWKAWIVVYTPTGDDSPYRRACCYDSVEDALAAQGEIDQPCESDIVIVRGSARPVQEQGCAGALVLPDAGEYDDRDMAARLDDIWIDAHSSLEDARNWFDMHRAMAQGLNMARGLNEHYGQ